MGPKRLSSALTFVYKFVFPAVWISIFGLGTAMLFLGAMKDKNGAPPPEEMRWAFLTAWLAGSGFILWLCAGLKALTLDGGVLRASNYRREIEVPASEIERVTENRWINIHPVTVYFRSPTGFGPSITFMPKARIFNWRPHPVVEELLLAAKIQS